MNITDERTLPVHNFQKKLTTAAAALACLFGCILPIAVLPTPALAEALRFAAMGDLPYNADEREKMPHWLDEIARTDPAFILHVGDFKGSRQPCSDALFADRHALFNASPVPFILTPGDNEWSDCHVLAAGGHDPEERLAALRRLFFADAQSLGQRRIFMTQQEGAPENLRWLANGILFITLNLPAGNNRGMKAEPSAEFMARDPMIQSWIQQGFVIAEQLKAEAVAIAFQANPGFKLLRKGMPVSGFANTLSTLQEEAVRWAKPVLLIHGDTHTWKFNQPLTAPGSHKRLPNVWRVEVPGSPRRGWVEITYHPDRPKAPFEARMHPLD